MARKRFWFAVAPTMYAVTKKVHEKKGIELMRYAQKSCMATTMRTVYLVRDSGPHSLITCAGLSEHRNRATTR